MGNARVCLSPHFHRRPHILMRSSNQLLGSLMAAIAAVQLVALADPLYAPSLLFNWRLRTVDAPVRLGGFTLTDPNSPNSPAVKTSSGLTANVEFIGSGISFNGQSSGWETTGSDGLPMEAGFAYVTGDTTWDSNNNKIFKPESDDVLWERSTPRFTDYSMGIQGFVGNWTLTSVDVMTGMNSSADSLEEVPARVESFVTNDGKLNPFYNTTGNWNVVPATGSLPIQAKCYDDAILRISIPKGTAYLVLNGTRSVASRTMYLVFQKNGDEFDTETDTINAEFPTTTESLLYMRPLDPSVSYVLVLTCVFTGNQGEQGLTSMTFYAGEPGDDDDNDDDIPGSGSNASPNVASTVDDNGKDATSLAKKILSTAAIAGIAVGAVVLVVLALLLWWCIRRRRRNAAPKMPPHGGIPSYQSGGNGEVDPTVPTPYQYQPVVQTGNDKYQPNVVQPVQDYQPSVAYQPNAPYEPAANYQAANYQSPPVSEVPYQNAGMPPSYGQQMKN